MTHDELQTAATQVASAGDATDADAADRLAELADQLDALATGDADPDHGRLARIQRSLADLTDEAGTDATAAIEDADDAINQFRETLEGV